MPKLTKTFVEGLQPGAKPFTKWDELLPGLGVRVTPVGLKTFFLTYRTQAGDQRQIRLGRYLPQTYTAEMARAEAIDKLAAIQAGADPRAARKAKRVEPTVGSLLDRYLAEHVKVHNKPRTQRRVEQVVRLRIRPALGSERLSALTPAMVRAWHAGMAATPTDANRALASLRKACSLAVADWGVLKTNPALGIKQFSERQGTRTFSTAELGRIGAVLADAEASGRFQRPELAAIRLLALTGLRTSEVLALQWRDVDLAAGVALLRDAKTGTRSVPLGSLAVALLQALERPGPWVVHAVDATKPLSEHSLRGAWLSIRREIGLGGDTGLHCFRRSAATLAAQSGASSFALRDAFGWAGLAMPNRYVQRVVAAGVPDLFGSLVGAALAGTPTKTSS